MQFMQSVTLYLRDGSMTWFKIYYGFIKKKKEQQTFFQIIFCFFHGDFLERKRRQRRNQIVNDIQSLQNIKQVELYSFHSLFVVFGSNPRLFKNMLMLRISKQFMPFSFIFIMQENTRNTPFLRDVSRESVIPMKVSIQSIIFLANEKSVRKMGLQIFNICF